MTVLEKIAHARGSLQRQRHIIADVMRYMPEASQHRHWLDEADRLGDLIDRTLYTAKEIHQRSHSSERIENGA